MADKKTDAAAAPEAAAKTPAPAEAKDNQPAETEEKKAEAAPSKSGWFKAWLPLIITIVLMPALAYAMTVFVLMPKLQKAIHTASSQPASEEAASTEDTKPSKEATAKDAKDSKNKKPKVTVPLNKVLVNVSGTMGTRYLMTSLTLVGSAADFKEKIESNRDQLMDVAASSLSSKTIGDLEKPGARNLIRTELVSLFNNTIGVPIVQEIYLTEFAIQ
jgi:flagellar FliL protein